MPNDYSSKRAIVYDYGVFLPIAESLAKWFGRVDYFMPWRTQFSHSNQLLVGSGIEGINRVEDFWATLAKADKADTLLVFPDSADGGLQTYLRDEGWRVWGCGNAERMEHDRVALKKIMAKLDMPVNEWREIKGLDNLRAWLEDPANEGWYVKVPGSRRGDVETWRNKGWPVIQGKFFDMAARLDFDRESYPFMVEAAVDDASEIGYDGFGVDGEWPRVAMWGPEIKDSAYLGAVMPYAKMPKQLRYANEALSESFRKMGLRGWYSNEVRVAKDGTPYATDLTLRAGSPPSEVYMDLYGNWADVMWHVADGETVDPEPVAAYGIVAMLVSPWAEGHSISVEIPKDAAPWVKLKNSCVREDGTRWVIWQEDGLKEIGAVVGIGDTVIEAAKACAEHAEGIEATDLEIKLDALPDAVKELRKGQDRHGWAFGDQALPTEDEVREAIAE